MFGAVVGDALEKNCCTCTACHDIPCPDNHKGKEDTVTFYAVKGQSDCEEYCPAIDGYHRGGTSSASPKKGASDRPYFMGEGTMGSCPDSPSFECVLTNNLPETWDCKAHTTEAVLV